VQPRRDWLPYALAVVAWIAIALGMLAFVAGFLPGRDIYADANDCVGHAFATAFSWHEGGHHASECTRRFVLVATESAGGWWLAALLAPILLGAVAVWRRPRTIVAVAWILLSYAAAVAVFMATFDLDLFAEKHVLLRWPAYVVDTSLLLVYGVMSLALVALPFVHLARALARHRRRKDAEPVFPMAIVRPRD
jgi:hypothetical protein